MTQTLQLGLGYPIHILASSFIILLAIKHFVQPTDRVPGCNPRHIPGFWLTVWFYLTFLLRLSIHSIFLGSPSTSVAVVVFSS